MSINDSKNKALWNLTKLEKQAVGSLIIFSCNKLAEKHFGLKPKTINEAIRRARIKMKAGSKTIAAVMFDRATRSGQ